MTSRVGESIREAYARVVAVALEEDLGPHGPDGDITTRSTVAASLWGSATVYAKQSGVVCGLEAMDATYAQLDDRVTVAHIKSGGDEVAAGDALARAEGPVAPILVGERTALNLIGHLSGIATLVSRFVAAAPSATLTDTRKTLPGLRQLEKYAVRVGGGTNHRLALWDAVLVKDTHIVAAGSVGDAVRRARAATAVAVQAECTSAEEVSEALDAGADAILLDNRSPRELRDLASEIKRRAPHVVVEASGGVTLDTVADIAATGVDRISVGAFTHSAPALDVSLRLERTWKET